MANKRFLKRILAKRCTDLFGKGITAYLHSDEGKCEKTDALMRGIMMTYSDFNLRVSHPEPGMAPKKYYAVLVKEFNEKMDGLEKELNDIIEK